MGRKNVIWKMLVLCLFFNTIQGQVLDKKYVYSSYSGLNADANIFSDISLNSYELLSTNVQFSKEDDLQKVVFVPFKLIDLDEIKNYNFLYNSKINLAQKNGVSTIGVGFTWDNSIPSSKRGTRIFNSFFGEVSLIKEEINSSFLKALQADLTNSKKGELNFILSESMQSWLGSEIVAMQNRGDAYAFPNEERSYFSKDKGFTYEDYLYYMSKKEAYNTLTKKKLDTDFSTAYYKALITNSMKLTLGGNLSFFSILGGDSVDVDNDGNNDNEHQLQQRNISLGFTHIVNEIWGYSFSGYLLWKRANAQANTDLHPYYGFSAAFGARTWILKSDYEKTEAYQEHLFVPSVHTGIALEYLKCDASDDAQCAEGLQSNLSVTPYIEFKISPKNQFRLGVPISSVKQLDSENATIGPFVQWRLQLSGNN